MKSTSRLACNNSNRDRRGRERQGERKTQRKAKEKRRGEDEVGVEGVVLLCVKLMWSSTVYFSIYIHTHYPKLLSLTYLQTELF